MTSIRPTSLPTACTIALVTLLLGCGGGGSGSDGAASVAPGAKPAAAPAEKKADPPAPPAAATPGAGEAARARRPAIDPLEVLGEKLPWPEGVPQYPGATTDTRGSEQGTVSRLTTNDPAEKLVAHYRDAFRAEGWEVDQDRGEGPRHLLAVHKADRKATLSVTIGRGATQAVLLVGAE